MRVLIQRVKESFVEVDNVIVGQINNGLVVLLGIENEDGEEDIQWLSDKLLKLRIFDDENGVMNLSVKDVKGEILVISQFTLHASTKKGARPSYIKAARPEIAIPLYHRFIEVLDQKSEQKTATGIFGAYMQVSLVNDGPVSIWIDSKNKE